MRRRVKIPFAFLFMDYEIKQIPFGDAGTDATVREMEKMIRDGVKDPLIRETAIGIVRGLPGKDYLGEIFRIYNWVKQNVRFTRDPVSLELLQSAARSLKGKVGDCDDYTVLLSALLQSLGHATRIKTIATRASEYHHVYPEVRVGEQWIPLDATQKQASPGWEPPDIVRKKIYSGLSEEMKNMVARTLTAAQIKGPIDKFRLKLQQHINNREVNIADLITAKKMIQAKKLTHGYGDTAVSMINQTISWIEQHPDYKKAQSFSGLGSLGDIWSSITDFLKDVAEVSGSIYTTVTGGQATQVAYIPQTQETKTIVVGAPWYYQILQPPTIYYLLGGAVILLFLSRRRR